MKIAEIKTDYNKVLKETAKIILDGGLVVFPSDTVYILAVDPTNEIGVKKLLEFKNRWTGKAISVAVLDQKMAEGFVKLNENSKNIYKNLLPGPFTIVSEGKHRVVKGIEAENGTLGIRIPDNRYIHDLVDLVGKPVTATSANLSGRTPNYSVASFLRPLSKKKKEMIDLIVDGGKLPKNKPSTVIDATESEIKILRRGDLITGKTTSLISKSEKETEKIAEFLLKRQGKNDKPLVFLLSGDLGCGKTVFSRKIGHLLGVKSQT
jgi:L-threonylcarbamoyladenylate synthase